MINLTEKKKLYLISLILSCLSFIAFSVGSFGAMMQYGILLVIGSVLFRALIIYFALINKIFRIILLLLFTSFVVYFLFLVHPESLIRDLKTVEYKYLFISLIFGGWAYVSRGLRWIVLINALGYTTSKKNSISAVSVGYLTNLFIPRAGEISRCISLNKSEDIHADKLFGTILIERVIDFVFLISLSLLTILLKSNEIIRSINEYQDIDIESSNTKFIILGVLFFIGLLTYLLKNKIKDLPFYQKIEGFIEGFKKGFKSIKNMKNKSSFWVHTLSIWIVYFLMTYICFFSIEETSHLAISDGLFLLVLGGIGMVIPTPGGIGSYHLIVMIGLVALQIPDGVLNINSYNEYNPAMLFPFVVHTTQTLLAIIMGLIGLWTLTLSKKKNNVAS